MGRKSEGRGLRKTTCNLLIKPLPSAKNLGTLKKREKLDF
jgi:hypothetical protein